MSRMEPIWQDREIRFDIPFTLVYKYFMLLHTFMVKICLYIFSQMRMRQGEKILDRLDSVEDTKGNGGTRGRLAVTNLRIIWHSISSPRINLCMLYQLTNMKFFFEYKNSYNFRHRI